MSGPRRVDYVLPLRWDTDQDIADLTRYLRWLQRHARVIVVDGSSPRLFESHHELWSGLVCHVAPEPDGFLNGKVTGVHTGMRIARAERVIIADDDVRYHETALRRTVDLLAGADLVGPQNVFDPMPWHAAWDTARSLLNRAVAADYPGTFAVRRSTFMRVGGYSGDVLFENLELMRTVRAYGGTVVRPRHLYVVRRPPTLDRFAGQRVRQAFDDLAQPWRLAIFLPVLPVTASRRGRRVVAVALAVSMLLAEAGRRRAGGAAVFPARTVLFAPVWVAERSICSWLAIGQRFLPGGVRYAGQRLPIAAHRTHLLPYRCAKFAAVGFSEGISAELAREGVRVTTVVPGLMRTGSPLNAFFKGQGEREFSWFTLADSIPGLSMDAERAAHRIVESMRRGRTEIVLTVPAKLAVRMQGAMPAATVNLLRVVDRLLPDTEDPDGRAERGMAVDARLTSAVFKRLTGLTRSAAHRFNQLPGPVASPPAVRSARPPGPSTEPDNDVTAGG